MIRKIIKANLNAGILFIMTILISPSAFAQAFLQPANGNDASFLSSTASGATTNTDAIRSAASTDAADTNDFVPSNTAYQGALRRFENEAAKLPCGGALRDISFGTSPSPPGCPFTDATRVQIETIASTWINASFAAGAGKNSSQILSRDRRLSNLINQDKQGLGSNYSTLATQDQLIQNQDMALVNMNGGKDLTKSKMKLLSQEENNLSSELKDLAGN